jgi:hypothetical protein
MDLNQLLWVDYFLALAEKWGGDYSISEAAKQVKRCEKATQYIKSLLGKTGE